MRRMTSVHLIFAAGLLLSQLVVSAASASDLASEAMAGHLRLIGPRSTAYFAIEAPSRPGQGLTGWRWAMGQGTHISSLGVCPDDGRGLPDMSAFDQVDVDLYAISDEWRELTLGEAAPSDTPMWIVMEVPLLKSREEDAGGSGVGYVTEAAPYRVLFGDPTGWGTLAGVSLAVEPVWSEVTSSGMGKGETAADPGASSANDVAETVVAFRGAWPNPSAMGTYLHFSIARSGPVTVDLFDLRGRKVRSIALQQYGPGEHALFWDGRDGSGAPVASGTYFAKLRAPDLSAQQRIVVIK